VGFREVVKGPYLSNQGVTEGSKAQFLVYRRGIFRVPNQIVIHLLLNAPLGITEDWGEQEEGQQDLREGGGKHDLTADQSRCFRVMIRRIWNPAADDHSLLNPVMGWREGGTRLGVALTLRGIVPN